MYIMALYVLKFVDTAKAQNLISEIFLFLKIKILKL